VGGPFFLRHNHPAIVSGALPQKTMNITAQALPLAIFKAGSTFPSLAAELGDFEDWIARRLAPSVARPLRVVDPRCDALPDPASLAGVIITGSHAMVSDREPWSEACAAWLAAAVPAGLPVLGICYGHQLLAHALGGEVGYHPGGLEIGTVEVETTPAAADDALFAALPPRFPAQVVHRQSVLRLPPGAVCLARNAFEPHHAFRIHRAWGVQFHPEFSAEAMAGYLAQLAQPGTPRATPEAEGVLRGFGMQIRD
jgi:GMP synthase (glutamine-hydrolysing)